MIVVPFKREHLKAMVIQQKQQGLEHLITDGVCASLEGGYAYTALDGEEVLACAGAVEAAQGRAILWAYLSQNLGSRMVGVTKACKRAIELMDYRRIEMDVDCNFPQAHRWAKLLGFEMECERRRSYTPDGRDCALYAMVRT
jgi:hypothetical protein